MKVEVVMTGLCSLLNVRDNHGEDMVEPSVILVRTDVNCPPGTPGPGFPPQLLNSNHHEHLPFIAFNGEEMDVDRRGDFDDVKEAPGFLFSALPEAVEIVFPGAPQGKPRVLKSYDLIVKKDHYWPDAKNQWNRAYVPTKGGRPSKDAVAAFLRFHQGDIGGGRLCPFEWSFQDEVGRTFTNQFAEEAIYTFEQGDEDIVVKFVALDDESETKVLKFTPRRNKEDSIPDQTLFIGNNMMEDIAVAVLRQPPGSVKQGDHFKFLNMVADDTLTGAPFPSVGKRIGRKPSGGGGGSAGACGPHSSNG
ncbi:MAG TPA: hypothetical protein VGR02_10865 [Thermoanaerobaculia bacterium]|jgi:hypothetical protein|nr:hypothetical protein [Thermoanaerobaculia bacterium]